MNSNWIRPFTILCVGAGMGFLAGHGQPFKKILAKEESARPQASRSRSQEDGPAGKLAEARELKVRSDSGPARFGHRELLLHFAGLSSAGFQEEAARLHLRPVAEVLPETLLLYGQWAETDPRAALAHARSLGGAGDVARRAALEGWAGYDPAAAAEYFGAHASEFLSSPGGTSDPVTGRDLAGSLVARAWARQDPQAAFRWAAESGIGRNQAMLAAIGETAKSNPALAAELAGSMDPSGRDKAYGEIASQWGLSDFSGAENWIRGLPPGQQDGAMAKAIGGLSIKSPIAAARHLDAMEAGTGRDLAVPELVRNWVAMDSAAAAEWLKGNPDEMVQRNGMPVLVSSMAVEDRGNALGFAKSLPKGRVQDTALAAYIRTDVTTAAPELLGLAESISDDADRGQSIAAIVSRWRLEDEEAAAAYVRKISGAD